MRRAGRDPAPLSFAQERVWFVNQLAPGNSTFNIDHALRLRYRLDPGLLTRALNEIVRRHETLRTVFRMVGDQPAQVVHEALEIQVPSSTCHTFRPSNVKPRRLDSQSRSRGGRSISRPARYCGRGCYASERPTGSFC